jgi:hypothetical protein
VGLVEITQQRYDRPPDGAQSGVGGTVGVALTHVAVRAESTLREGNMFEELEKEQREQKEETKKLTRITVIIVSVLVVVGAIVYITSRPRSKAPQTVNTAGASSQSAPDPVKDLKIVRAIMGKDPTGVRVMWSVQLQNKSDVYTYSDIQYEARFIGPDGKTRTANQDVIKDSIAPGEEKKFPEFIDGIYDANSSTYQFVLLGAKATTQ